MIRIYSSPSSIPGLRALPEDERKALWKQCYRECAQPEFKVFSTFLGLALGAAVGAALHEYTACILALGYAGFVVGDIPRVFKARTLAAERASALASRLPGTPPQPP